MMRFIIFDVAETATFLTMRNILIAGWKHYADGIRHLPLMMKWRP